MKKLSEKRGFSLVEMVLYVAILVLMMTVIINIFLSLSRTQRSMKSARTIQNSGIFALNRMAEETRGGLFVKTASSTFNVSPGVLVLNTIDASGNPKTVEFSLSNGVLRLKDNGVDQGALTQLDSRVTNLIFSLITSSSSQAVRTQMTVESGTSTWYKSKKFYSTVIIRGSYVY
ncbi:hypothetical protein KW790_03065 [Candidatus Parcubacteria bacterium]|nr:hypothetical protein [Candidatus Parcubacteria bacterium]